MTRLTVIQFAKCASCNHAVEVIRGGHVRVGAEGTEFINLEVRAECTSICPCKTTMDFIPGTARVVEYTEDGHTVEARQEACFHSDSRIIPGADLPLDLQVH